MTAPDTAQTRLVRLQRTSTTIPSWQYLGRQGWGRYDEAVAVPAAQAEDLAAQARRALGDADAPGTVEVVEQHPLDLDGFPMTDTEIGWVRLTHCCAAACSISTGPLYCKSCYEAQPWTYDGPARTRENPDARERTGLTGPVRIDLTRLTAVPLETDE